MANILKKSSMAEDTVLSNWGMAEPAMLAGTFMLSQNLWSM
jgi:hypothetical protein